MLKQQTLVFPFSVFAALFILASTTFHSVEAHSHRHASTVGRLVLKHQRKLLTQTEHGEISGASVTDGAKPPYHLHFITLEPNSVFLPVLLHADIVLFVHTDMASAAFIDPLPVIEFVAQLLGKDVPSRPLSDYDRVKIKKALRGVKVEVTHRRNVRRKYRVSGLTSQPTRELVFPVDDNSTMNSVVEYFEEMYGFTIQQTHLPCLQVGNQRKANYLPMEACKIVVGQRYTMTPDAYPHLCRRCICGTEVPSNGSNVIQQ